MKFELTHDILARAVYDKSSNEDKNRRKMERFIRERYEHYLTVGELLSEVNLEYIAPYLSQVDISKEEERFIEKSKAHVKRRKNRNFFFILLGIAALVAFLGWKGYDTYKKEMKIAKEEAIQLAQEAKSLEEKIKQSELEAESYRQKAQEADENAKQLREQAKNAKTNAIIASNDARRTEQYMVITQAQMEQERQSILSTLGLLQNDANEIKALQLASLAVDKLQQGNGVLAFQLAQQSWQTYPTLTAQKVLFDFYYEAINNPTILKEPEAVGFTSYLIKQKNANLLRANFKGLSEAVTDKAMRVKRGTTSSSNKVKIANDNTHVLTIFEEEFQVWNVSTNTTTDFIHGDSVINARFSDDGKYLASWSANKEVKIWAIGGTLLHTLPFNTDIKHLEFSPGELQYLLITTSDGKANVWNFLTKNIISTFEVENLAYAPKPAANGLHALMMNGNKEPVIYNYKNNTQIILPSGTSTIDAKLSPVEDYILTSNSTGEAVLWNFYGNKIRQYTHGSPIDYLKFSPDGQEIITASYTNQTAKLWEIDNTQEPLSVFRYEGYDPINAIEFSSDGRRVLIVRNTMANLWGIQGRLLCSFEESKVITAAKFTNNSESILVAYADGSVDFWNIVSPQGILNYYNSKIRELTPEEQKEYLID